MKLLKKISRYSGILALAIVVLVLGLHSNISHKDMIDDSYQKSKSVMILGAQGQCSGEQITAPSGVGYILSAGHCKGLVDSNGMYKIVKEDGSSLLRKLIAEDPKSDLLLIEGLPGVIGLKVAGSLEIGEAVKTFTHGNGMPTYRTEGHILASKRIQVPIFPIETDAEAKECDSMPKYKKGAFMFSMVCAIDVSEMVIDALIIPGSSGGMILNSQNELVGVASATGGGLGYMVSLSDIKDFIAGY